MSTRRRYDTTALVTKMRQERRRNIVLGVCAAGTLAALVVFYLLNMRGMSIPEVPADASPRAPRAGETSPQVTAAPTMVAPMAPPADAPAPTAKPIVIEEKPPLFSTVRSNMPAAALVWVDDAAVQRGTQLQLTEGRHAVRVKIGKHALREHIDVKPGENVELRLDARKKKLVVERHPATKPR